MVARFSAPVQTGPRAHPASRTMDTGSFPGVKSGPGVTLNPHLLLVPWSIKSRAIPILPLRTLRPLQSFSACTRVHLPYIYARNRKNIQVTQHVYCFKENFYRIIFLVPSILFTRKSFDLYIYIYIYKSFDLYIYTYIYI